MRILATALLVALGATSPALEPPQLNTMYRVPRGAFNKTQTDETTDSWDTIDRLVKSVTPNMPFNSERSGNR